MTNQGLRAHFTAQIDQPQGRHILAEQGQQGGHSVQNSDLVRHQRTRQSVWIRGNFLGRNPQSSAYRIADPDFLERHVERHGKTLIHTISFTDAQLRVFAAQEMANTALADFNALGLAG